jgi:hypothetical protein
MASEEADQQAATDVHTRLVQRNKEQLMTELQRSCETQDRVIRDAWKKIVDSVQVARDTQSRVVSVYNTGLSENTFRIVTADVLPEMTLPSYRDIAAHFTNSSPQLPWVNTTPAVSPAFPSPQASPTLPRSQHPGQVIAVPVPDRPHPAPAERSGTVTADDQNAPVPNNKRPPKRAGVVRRPRLILYHIHPRLMLSQAKRSGAGLSAARQAPRKRARTDTEDDIAMRTVDANSVKAREYIFPFPSLSRGWYVLRCDLGQPKNQRFIKFMSHPSQSPSEINLPPAMNHFMNRTCQGHEAKRYTDLQIVQEFGFRGTCSISSSLPCYPS